MKTLVHIGAGSHARKDHLEPLALYQARHPGRWRLAAICDLDAQRAQSAADQFGFEHACTDLDAMFTRHKPDAAVAITPHHVTADLTIHLITFGVPLLIEKPIGQTRGQVDAVCDAAQHAPAPVMVSMNRRFDPQLTAAVGWIAGRPIRAAAATLARHARLEPHFIQDAALHPLDALTHLLGPLTLQSATPFGRGAGGLAQLAASDARPVQLTIAPDAGHWVERYDLIGDGFHVQIDAAAAWRAWADGRPAAEHTASGPGHVNRGAYAETAAFLDAAHAGKPLAPTPADTRPATQLTLDLAARLTHRPTP